MTSATSSGVSSSASQQAGKLAFLAKLFQTTGKPAESGKSRPATAAASPPPPPPAQSNSAAGLASMYAALQNDDTSSVSDLLSRLLQAVDTDGDGTISADELQAVTELATGQTQADRRPTLNTTISQTEGANEGARDDIAASLATGPFGRDITAAKSDPAQTGPAGATQSATTTISTTTTAYEALFQAMQLVFAQRTSATTNSQRYTELLKSLAKAA